MKRRGASTRNLRLGGLFLIGALTGVLVACTPAGGDGTPTVATRSGGQSCDEAPPEARIGDAPILYTNTVYRQATLVLYEDGVLVTFFPRAFRPLPDATADGGTQDSTTQITAAQITAAQLAATQPTTAQLASTTQRHPAGPYPRALVSVDPEWPVVSAVSPCVLADFAELAAELRGIAERTDGDLGDLMVTDQSTTSVTYGVDDPFSVWAYGLGGEREYPHGLSREEVRGREVMLDMQRLLQENASDAALLPLEQIEGVELSVYSSEAPELDETWPLGPLEAILTQRDGTCGVVAGENAQTLLEAFGTDDFDEPYGVSVRVLTAEMEACPA